MTSSRMRLLRLLSGAMLLTMPAVADAQGLYVYPARGQSPQQEESDKGQCYGWAVQQSGFNPADPQVGGPPPPPAYSPQPQGSQGGMFRGAMGGAALGAVGGAIGGNAGEGAAIGAGVGALFGGLRRARERREEQQEQQSYAAQQQGAMDQGRSNYE